MRRLPPVPETLNLYEVLDCLSDPIRLSIVSELDKTDDMECGTFKVEVTKSTLTHHFRVLRETGVISTTNVGTRSLNRLRRAELDKTFPGLLDSVLKSYRKKK